MRTHTPQTDAVTKIFDDLFQENRISQKDYLVSKTVPLIDKTSMELGSTGLRFFTETLEPQENLNYLIDQNAETTWRSLNNA